MSYFKNRIFFSTITFLIIVITGCSHDRHRVQDIKLKDRWEMQSTAKVHVDDQKVSTADFKPDHWYTAHVPGSILGSLVADSVYKNVFYGRDLTKIPDSLFNMPWWYRTSFNLSKLAPDRVIRLQFDGINYRADIWLNGHKIASSDSVEGGFRRFNFNVSHFIKKGKNILAVKVTRPYPGELTLGFVDWNPEPPDHNMGIWRDVRLQVTGPVSVDQPFVQTKVDTATLDHADLTINTLLQNHSGKKISGQLKGTIGDTIAFSQPVDLRPKESKKIAFTPSQYPQLSMDHPRLWWVHTLGKPNLYNLQLQFIENGAVSDSQHVHFGIRSVSDYFTSDGHRGFKLNGKKILIKGGGWTDPMLMNATPAYEQAGIDYAVHMNLNTIRMEGFWGNNQHLYNLCDKKGILVMAGLSCQWEWKEYLGTKEDEYSAIITPKQNDIAARSWQDQLVWLRNHPSIFVWLYGSDKYPRPSLEKRYLSILKDVDPTRPSVASAGEPDSDITGPAGLSNHSSISGPVGLKMRGPYDYVPPNYWYEDKKHGGAFGFNTETGPGPQIPVRESLEKMIPADSLWPISEDWLYHAARHNFQNFTYYNNAMDNRLGKPEDLDDYLRRAQYLNYEGMRAMYEAFEANRFKSTGIIQWMFNASWPKLWWQLYDYYLMPTGAFYGARKANEPIHISYNYGNHAVGVINNTSGSANNLYAEIRIFDFNMKQKFQKKLSVNSLDTQHTQQIFSLPANLNLSTTWFLALRLYDHHHQVVSTNFYTLSTQKDKLDESKSTWYTTPESQYADLTLLQKLPAVKLQSSQEFEEQNDTTFVHVKLKNPTPHLAFMVHLDLRKKESHQSVVPIFWEDNYITLLPGEERTISGYCHAKDLKGQKPIVTMTGWNIK